MEESNIIIAHEAPFVAVSAVMNTRYETKLLPRDIHNLRQRNDMNLYEFLTNITNHWDSIIELSFPDERNMDILLCFIVNKSFDVSISFILNSVIYPDTIMLPYCNNVIPSDLTELILDGKNPIENYEVMRDHIRSGNIFDKFQTLNPDKINTMIGAMSVEDRNIFPHISNTTTCGCNCSTYITLNMMCNLLKSKINEYSFNGKNLSTLVHMKNLNSLRISNNTQITDITPIGYLHLLTWLRLQDCPNLIDITPLKYLSNVQVIELNNCSRVEDATPLVGLKNLLKLIITGTSIRNTSMLRRTTHIE